MAYKNWQLSVLVEGNVGAGKSTFLKIIQKYLHVQLIHEPLDKWQNIHGENLLEYFYRDPQRWAYTFQSYAFVSRILEQEASAKINTKPIQVLERSVYSDRYCFAKNAFELGMMNQLEWKLYQEWFNWLISFCSQRPHAFIYLYTEPEICYERVLKRNRQGEQNVSLEYLRMLHVKHEDWLRYKKDVDTAIREIPVLILEGNYDFEHSIETQEEYIKQIVEFIALQFELPPLVLRSPELTI